ncbi:uncharacterized protein LOC108101811 [Drosophila ficusphila]|uniref:uncharacterized protein LOC108101811 n=1 Tax=Drosophila ficusphila TaxID=30025 RepID=UPI0007E6CC0E|nr:uncharacterized protein LOC108101811 [Drosophila ficusphila]
MNRIHLANRGSIGPEKSVKSVQLASSLFQAKKPKDAAKKSATSPGLSDTKAEKPKSEERRSIKLANARSQIVGKAASDPKPKTYVNASPATGSSRRSGTTRNTTSTGAKPFLIPLKVSSSVTSRIYRSPRSGAFHYHLSQLEEDVFGQTVLRLPMKSVPSAELQLLRDGQRATYLERRYERSPDDKYNYPEATSWRYGWFHRESDPFQKRLPRRD